MLNWIMVQHKLPMMKKYDKNNEDYNYDEVISNTIASSCPNRKSECVTLKLSTKICEKESTKKVTTDEHIKSKQKK